MKKDWTIKKLGEVVKVERGSSPRPIEKYLTTESNGVNWVKIGDTKNVDKVILSTKEKITPEGAEKSRFVQKGDFILSNSMSLGKPYIMGIDGYIHDGWFVLRLPETIDSDYFFYHLSSDFVQNQFSGLAAGAIVKNISSDLVKKANLIIPPLEEQKRIVAVLDEKFAQIETLKTATEKNLQNTKQLFQAELEKAFSNTSWEKKRLEKIANIKSGFAFKSSAFKTEGEYQVLRLGNVKQNYLRVEEKAIFVSDISESDFSKAKVNIGDLVVTQTGTKGKRDYGFVAIVDRDNLLLNQRLAAITVSEELYNRFLLYYSYTEDFKDQFFANEGGTVGQGNIGLTDIKEIEIPLPPLEEQKFIVSHLDSLSEKIHQLEEIYTKQLADCDELKQSLLQEAFEGEL